eukprot:4009725-Pyramimonas_sp.AAC.1
MVCNIIGGSYAVQAVMRNLCGATLCSATNVPQHSWCNYGVQNLPTANAATVPVHQCSSAAGRRFTLRPVQVQTRR